MCKFSALHLKLYTVCRGEGEWLCVKRGVVHTFIIYTHTQITHIQLMCLAPHISEEYQHLRLCVYCTQASSDIEQLYVHLESCMFIFAWKCLLLFNSVQLIYVSSVVLFFLYSSLDTAKSVGIQSSVFQVVNAH